MYFTWPVNIEDTINLIHVAEEIYFFRYHELNALFLFPLTFFNVLLLGLFCNFVIIILLDCDNYNRDDFCNQQDVCENIIL